MLKVNQSALEAMERKHQGIVATIMKFENDEQPVCPQCGSDDTAEVQVGRMSRSIYLVGATTRVKLVPNAQNRLGKYCCNQCDKFFN